MKRGTKFRIKVRDREGLLYSDISPHQLLLLAAMSGVRPLGLDAAECVVEITEGDQVRECAGFELYGEEE